jgi:hypothetical protein
VCGVAVLQTDDIDPEVDVGDLQGSDFAHPRARLRRDERQGVLFYLYSSNLAALRDQLLVAGIEAGEIEDGSPGPRQEMRVVDPDGYVLMVAQIEGDGPAA